MPAFNAQSPLPIGWTLPFCSGFALALLASGCDYPRRDHKPYTPFGVVTALPVEKAASVSASAAASAAPVFVPGRAEDLNPGTESYSLDGTPHHAPSGMQFGKVLALDPHKNGQRGLAAWLVPTDGSARGALYWFSRTEGPRLLKDFPGFVPSSSACDVNVQLTASGATSVTLDVGAKCKGSWLARSPMRSIAVLDLRSSPSQLLELRLAPPSNGDNLLVNVDTTDRDGDSRDDVSLEFSLANGATAPALAHLSWLDRAAGLARDPDEPVSSFLAIAKASAARGKSAGQKSGEILLNARRLIAFLCQEAGAFRLSDETGSAFHCGNLQKVYDQFFESEVRGALAQKNYPNALFALSRADWNLPAVSAKLRQTLGDTLRRSLGEQSYTRRELPLRVKPPPQAPHFSPLTFNAQTLLVLTRDGVVRVDPDQAPRDATAEFDGWSLLVNSSSNQSLMDVTYPCDDATLRLDVQNQDGTLAQLLDLGWLAPRPGTCASNVNFYRPPLRPIAWTSNGLSAWFGPISLGPLSPGPHAGAPLSPDGQAGVSPTPLGLYVKTPTEQFLVKYSPGDELTSDCVISNGALAIACRSANGVLLLQRSPNP